MMGELRRKGALVIRKENMPETGQMVNESLIVRQRFCVLTCQARSLCVLMME